MLGAGLSAKIRRAMAALLRGRSRRLLRIASPGSRAPWSDLPADLLALVLSRLPSQTDRVRLRAVCRSWRSAARLRPLPPPLPWLFVRRDTFLTLPEGALHRMPLDLDEILLRVPTGGVFFLVHRDGRCSLMNPSSGEMTPLHIDSNSLKIDLSCRSYNWISKVVVSDRIVAVAVPYSGMVTIFPRAASPGARLCWVPPASTDVDTDIALFQGEIYVVLTKKHSKSGSELPELHRLEIGDEQNRVSVVEKFVVWDGAVRESGSRTILTQLMVWEGVDLIGSHGHWSKVDTLMGHALFVSRGCSESLPAQCGARQDCIYSVMTEAALSRKREPQDDVLRCVVYNVRDRTMEPLETKAATASPWEPTWFFPADA